ncbi:hypothetical protein QAD02_002974 [Eretmocerus hayati]|uniref:Uncharacterized protein n=1 Tax=Eretmocerus hayati TaxID=131215 RepID=A0ACC2NQA1_9HYME|nr:hypothetical protein QAD02_002974 [Eretmocerus hayati]
MSSRPSLLESWKNTLRERINRQGHSLRSVPTISLRRRAENRHGDMIVEENSESLSPGGINRLNASAPNLHLEDNTDSHTSGTVSNDSQTPFHTQPNHSTYNPLYVPIPSPRIESPSPEAQMIVYLGNEVSQLEKIIECLMNQRVAPPNQGIGGTDPQQNGFHLTQDYITQNFPPHPDTQFAQNSTPICSPRASPNVINSQSGIKSNQGINLQTPSGNSNPQTHVPSIVRANLETSRSIHINQIPQINTHKAQTHSSESQPHSYPSQTGLNTTFAQTTQNEPQTQDLLYGTRRFLDETHSERHSTGKSELRKSDFTKINNAISSFDGLTLLLQSFCKGVYKAVLKNLCEAGVCYVMDQIQQKLTGKAETDFYHRMLEFKSVDEFLKAIMERYCLTHSVEDILFEINNTSEVANETPDDLGRRIPTRLDEYNIMIGLSPEYSDAEKDFRRKDAAKAARDRYLFCLGNEVELLVRLEEPEDLDQAIQHARRIDSERKRIRGNSGNTTPTQILYTRTQSQSNQSHTQNASQTQRERTHRNNPRGNGYAQRYQNMQGTKRYSGTLAAIKSPCKI